MNINLFYNHIVSFVYRIHKDHISKHYNFEISWTKISDDEELVKKIDLKIHC